VTELRALSSRLTTASPVFVHHRPSLGPRYPISAAFRLTPLPHTAAHRSESSHGLGFPMSSLRHSAVDLHLLFQAVSASLNNLCERLSKFPTIPLVCTQRPFLSTPVYSRHPFRRWSLSESIRS